MIKEETAKRAARLFKDFISRPGYSCLGAKAVVNEHAYVVHCYSELGSDCDVLAADFYDFVASPLFTENRFATFGAIFLEPSPLTERQFEERLWSTLQQLHQIDAKDFSWDPTVASEPTDPNFAFSFARHAFYVIGLHAESSRVARRFRFPSLIFNAHEQFRRLRAAGNWERMKGAIRKRDRALQGSVNPMLNDFGEVSEARQYSGRAVSSEWQARFHPAPPLSLKRCPFGH